MSFPESTYIYHFTHARNLEGILRAGCVYCQSRLPEGRRAVDLSHLDLQGRRSKKRVGCGPGGVLHDYVPFYFAARSPMMYVLSRGGVEGYDGGTRSLIYMVSSVQRVREAGLRYVFTDGHPVKAFTEFFDDASKLATVDWEVMNARIWKDREDDPDRMRRRMAEFLVYGSFPWDAVEFMAVKDGDVKVRLEEYLREQYPHWTKPVRVEAGWYF